MEGRKTRMKRWLITILALLCAVSLAACSGGKNPGNTTDSKNNDATDNRDSESPVPDTLDYNNIQLNIGVRDRDDIAFELDPERNTVDKMVTAIENRNRYTEDKLNLSLHLTTLPATWAQRADFITAIRNVAKAGGDDMIDILFGPSYSMVTLMLEGYFQNLYDTDAVKYLDLESSYWNSSFIDECTYAGKLYMLEGELTLTMLDSSFVMFCDTQLFKSKVADESLYNVVRDYKWTFEKMEEYVTLFGWVDNDSNDRKSNGDTFGLVSPAFSCGRDGFPTAFGVTVVSKDSDGKITTTFVSEQNVNIYSEFYRFVNQNEGVFVNGNNDGAREECRKMFTAGQSVFITELLNYAGTLRTQDRDYGIFPLPMYNEAQSSYYTLSEAVHSQISILAASEKIEAASAALEEMGYQTHKLVIDEYFNTVKYRNNREPESIEMLNIILDSVTSSFGAEFSEELRSPFPTPIGSAENVSDLKGQEDAIILLMNTLKRKIQALK